MTTIFFYVLLFQIKDWDKICEEEGKMTSPIICYILLGVILFIILMRILSILQFLRLKRKVKNVFPRNTINLPVNKASTRLHSLIINGRTNSLLSMFI